MCVCKRWGREKSKTALLSYKAAPRTGPFSPHYQTPMNLNLMWKGRKRDRETGLFQHLPTSWVMLFGKQKFPQIQQIINHDSYFPSFSTLSISFYDYLVERHDRVYQAFCLSSQFRSIFLKAFSNVNIIYLCKERSFSLHAPVSSETSRQAKEETEVVVGVILQQKGGRQRKKLLSHTYKGT